MIDVGTGGGFPLMPLALSCPECRFLGIDSVRKKTLAVNEMLADLEQAMQKSSGQESRISRRASRYSHCQSRRLCGQVA